MRQVYISRRAFTFQCAGVLGRQHAKEAHKVLASFLVEKSENDLAF